MSVFDPFLTAHGALALAGCFAAMFLGGFVKGVVGFALPLVAMSTMGSFLPYETALGLLILPTVSSNLLQGLRDGAGAAWRSFWEFRWLNLVMMGVIALAAQIVVALPERVLFGVLGAAVSAFSLTRMAGWQLTFAPEHRRRTEVAVGVVAGVFGGLSGIWGPPIIMYMLAARVPKAEMVRALALSFSMGALVLVSAHLVSGVLNRETLPVSAALVLPAFAAMYLGFRIQDRLDQEKFNRAVLVVLTLAGLNLLRRAVLG